MRKNPIIEKIQSILSRIQVSQTKQPPVSMNEEESASLSSDDVLLHEPLAHGDQAYLFDVYHADYSNHEWFLKRIFLRSETVARKIWQEYADVYRYVALVQAKDLDEVFCLTNAVEASLWTHNRQILWKREERLRSTSVGDVLVHRESGRVWMIASFGFYEILAIQTEE